MTAPDIPPEAARLLKVQKDFERGQSEAAKARVGCNHIVGCNTFHNAACFDCIAAALAEERRRGREETLSLLGKLAEFKAKIGHTTEATALNLAVSIAKNALDESPDPDRVLLKAEGREEETK